jgi:hypothetical protein
MNPYVLVSINGKEVYQTSPHKRGHRTPSWNATYKLNAREIPDHISIAVWNRNVLHRDVFCGGVSIPLSSDMCSLVESVFAITKRREITGAIRLSLRLVDDSCDRFTRKPSDASECSLGAELDNVMGWIDEQYANDATDMPSGNPKISSNALQIAERGTAPLGEVLPPVPSERTPKTSDARYTPKARNENNIEALVPLQSCDQEELIVPLSANMETLAGKWKCVATTGLEEFLKLTGVPMFQRKIAMSASWPSWDFAVEGDLVKYVNHSALGDLNETILLDGTKYSWRDGKGHEFESRAEWTDTPDGGVLTIYREGKLAKYSEQRCVSGDTLTFTLSHGDGAAWGRTFQRA